ADGGAARESFGTPENNDQLLLNAEEILAPVISSISPSSGSTAGANTVTITGLYLDGATGVTFGPTPASSFHVESSSRITAVAPASSAATVDVHVAGPGGSSEAVAGDRYTFTVPALTPTLPGSAPSLAVKPAITHFSQSSARWRRGRSLAS